MRNEFSERSIDWKIKRQKAIEQELGCKFIRIEWIMTKKTLILSELSIKCVDTSKNWLKKL